MALVKVVDLKILAQSDDARRQLDIIAARAEAIGMLDPTIKVRVDSQAVTQGLKVLAAETAALQKDTTIRVNSDGLAEATVKAKATQAEMAALQAQIQATGLEGDEAFAGATAAMAEYEAKIKDARDALIPLAAAQSFFISGGGGWGFLTGKVVLFGGLLDGILPKFLAVAGIWHIATDAVIEFAAVLVPAIIGIGAFAGAAEPAVDEIYEHLTSLNTVVQATGKSIPPMTDAFSKMAQAVQPEVYQIYGDALTVMNQKSGAFQELAVGVGHALDTLAARTTAALTSGNGFSKWMADAIPDVAKLGDIVGNLGGFFGNLMNAMPGYAQILLNVADGFTKLLEGASASLEPVIHWGLAIHGAILYGGLAVTAIVALAGPLKSLVLWVGGGVVALFRLGAQFIATAAQGDFFGAAMTFINATGGPVVWAAVAIGALVALAVAFSRGKDATQQLTSALQDQVSNATSVTGAISAISVAQSRMSLTVALATAKLGTVTKSTTGVIAEHVRAVQVETPQYQALAEQLDEATAGQKQFSAEAVTSNSRLATLAKAYGGTSNALGLLNAAGITGQQWTDQSAAAWLRIQLQVNSTANAYKLMGETQSQTGHDLQVMDFLISDQYTAMTKLNQSWDTFVSFGSSAANAFLTFAQNAKPLAADLNAAGASMRGVGGASLTLQQSFQQSYSDAQPLIDALREGLPSGGKEFNDAVKNIVGQMLPFAKNSQSVTDQLVLLADQANYTGGRSFSGLVDWIGKANISQQALKKYSDDATEGLTNLSKEAADLNNALQQDLNQTLIQTGLKVYNVSGLMTAYTTDIKDNTAQTAAGQATRQALISSIIATGKMAYDTNSQIATMIATILKIPYKEALSIVVDGTGSYKVTGTTQTPYHRSAQGGIGGQKGLRVPGYGGGDRYPAMLEGGEAVVPKHLVKAVAPFLAAHKVPGFAAGGIIGSYAGSSAPGLGSWLTDEYNATVSALAGSVASATAAAIAAAITTTALAYVGGRGSATFQQIESWWTGAGGPGGGIAEVAAAITGAESGFDPTIVQQGQPYATTGWGLWQITPGDSEPQAGINQQLLTGPSNAIAAVAKYRQAGDSFEPWTTYTSGRYEAFMPAAGHAAGGLIGGPQGTQAHQMAWNWFDRGGWLPPGKSVAVNSTGRPERVLGPGEGGVTYQINVTVGAGIHPAQAGKEIVDKIRAFERASGTSWRNGQR